MVVRLTGGLYAFAAEQVAHVALPLLPMEVPTAPPLILGIVYVQGRFVAVVDLKMPAINGEGLAELVRKNTKIPVIIHSSEPLAVLQEKARATGAVGAIAKTPDDNLFIAQFERLFARCTASGARSSEKDSQDTGRNSEPKPNY